MAEKNTDQIINEIRKAVAQSQASDKEHTLISFMLDGLRNQISREVREAYRAGWKVVKDD